MSNKIQGYGTQPPVVTGGAKTGGVDRPAAPVGKVDGPAAPAGDSVTLTNSARTLTRLADAVAAAPVTDAERVSAVKKAVSQGTYQVDAQRVADKLLAANRELPGR
jgi:negative regulator of flagellin synthesis FlgM